MKTETSFFTSVGLQFGGGGQGGGEQQKGQWTQDIEGWELLSE
jgi:hypothetical protein